MIDELEKIDLLRTRAGLSYKEAKEVLEANGGDIVQALIDLEEKSHKWGKELSGRGKEIWDQFKKAIQKSREAKIKIKQGERTVFEFPASLGVLGILGALASSELALLGMFGSIIGLARKYTLEIEHFPKEEEGQKIKGD